MAELRKKSRLHRSRPTFAKAAPCPQPRQPPVDTLQLPASATCGRYALVDQLVHWPWRLAGREFWFDEPSQRAGVAHSTAADDGRCLARKICKTTTAITVRPTTAFRVPASFVRWIFMPGGGFDRQFNQQLTMSRAAPADVGHSPSASVRHAQSVRPRGSTRPRCVLETCRPPALV